MMQVPLFEPLKPLSASDPLPGRISEMMGIDYNGYMQYRQSDKSISFLIGKSVDRNANPVEWGRPATDNSSTDRPPVDRSSGLYNSRRSAMNKETSSNPVVKKTPTPAAAKGTPKAGANIAEDILKDDLYLTSSDDEAPGDANSDVKDAKLSHRAGGLRRTADSLNSSKSKGVKDLSYWMSCTEKLKGPSASNSDGAATPDDQKSNRGSTHESQLRDFGGVKKDVDEDKESVTPKSTESGAVKYRELVKNGLDSLTGQRPARRSNLGRMLSGLHDTDDEGPSGHSVVTEVKLSKRSKYQNDKHSSAIRHHTPLSPVSNTLEWKRRKSRSPAARSLTKQASNCFVDRKISRSPQRELVPYNDLDDDASDSSPDPPSVKPTMVKTESNDDQSHHAPERKFCERKVSPALSPVPLKRRKLNFEKTAPSSEVNTSKHATKSNNSPTRRHRSIKIEPKTEPKVEPKADTNSTIFDRSIHGFKRDLVDKYHVSFIVELPLTTPPSHRKRKRRENVSPVKVETSKESSNGDHVPPTQCPVQSSSTHSNSDSDSQHRLAETGGFHVSSTDPFEVESPATDPMVDPTFDRDLSDVESDYEVITQRHAKKSPTSRSHNYHHRHRPSMSQSNACATSPLKGASSRVVSQSVDQHSTDNTCESSALRASLNTFDHKLGHTNGASNLVGPSLPLDSKRETTCKKSPESRTMARPSSPARGDRTMLFKTSPVHESSSISTTIKSEPVADPLKPKPFNEPLYKSMPKIPRKRPPVARTDEQTESKKKRKQSQDQLPPNPDESSTRDVPKVKEKETTKEKKIRDRPKNKKIKSEAVDVVKREPSSPPSRGRFEVSVSDSCLPERSFSPSPADNAAPFLPPASAAAFSEMATQCELMPAVDRDISESGTHTKRMAVAFRIEGGRGNTPIVSAETRTQPQTPRSSGPSGGLLQPSMSVEGHSSGGGGGAVPRRRSSASVDESEASQNVGADNASDPQEGPQRSDSNDSLMDAVIRHRNLQEKIIQNENIAYQRMNSTQCFSEAAAKKHEADRLKNEGPARFALHALRACYLFIQACYVEERQGKLDNATMHYRETMHYVRSTSHMIEQVTKVNNSELLNSQKARVRHNFITLLCTEMKAILNYRVYFLAHRDTARLRQEVERELSRCGAGTGANGASERSTPESLTRSPATSCTSGSSGASLHLIGEGHHKLLRYLHHTKCLLAAQEYWQHAQLLRSKHGADLKKIEERVFRRARHDFIGPDTPVPCFLRYLNTFLTLHENGEL